MDWSAQSNSGGRHVTHQDLARRMIEQKRAPATTGPASAATNAGTATGDDDRGDTDTGGGSSGGPAIPAPTSVRIQSQNGEIPEQILIGYPDDPYEELYAMNADGDDTHMIVAQLAVGEDEHGNKITKTFASPDTLRMLHGYVQEGSGAHTPKRLNAAKYNIESLSHNGDGEIRGMRFGPNNEIVLYEIGPKDDPYTDLLLKDIEEKNLDAASIKKQAQEAKQKRDASIKV
jgi:hypothetical protein